MKCFTTSILILFFSSSIYGQLSQGMKQIGGTITLFQDQTNNDYVLGNEFLLVLNEGIEREISFLPRIGYFLTNNTSLGFGLGYSNLFTRQDLMSQSGEAVLVNEVRTNLLVFEVFSRIHFSTAENLFLFLEPSFTTSFGNAKNGVNTEVKEQIRGVSIGINPGILYMISERFGLEGSIGFFGLRSNTRKIAEPSSMPEGKNIELDFGLDLSMQTLDVGFQFYF